MDLIERQVLQLSQLKFAVLDEADHMFDMGFLPNVRQILRLLPERRQNLLFSATMPKTLAAVVKDVFGEKPLMIETQGSNKVVRTLKTDNRDVPHGRRIEVLGKVIGENSRSGIIEHAPGDLDQLGRFIEFALLRQSQQRFVGAGSPEKVGETGGEFVIIEFSDFPGFQDFVGTKVFSGKF
mgnify:CR=1 FL=1